MKLTTILALAASSVQGLANFDIDSTPNAVGIFYSVWHSLGYDGTNPPPDITEIQNGNGGFQGQGVFHCVCTAKQQSYISDKSTATGRNQGQTYATQWSRAFGVHPKVVMLTWWNEWMAQRQADDANGNPQFVDAYDSEYSRDIEPQDPNQPGSHGGKYLDWTRQYIASYKANAPMPQGLVGY